jgi:hypothetical protein
MIIFVAYHHVILILISFKMDRHQNFCLLVKEPHLAVDDFYLATLNKNV